jgi:hypothetical protein
MLLCLFPKIKIVQRSSSSKFVLLCYDAAMKTKFITCSLGLTMLLTACPTPRPLDAINSENIKRFGPDAVASTAQFLRGAPVDVSNATQLIQQGVPRNLQASPVFGNIPSNLGTQFANPKLRGASARAKMTPQMQTIFSKHGLQVQASGGTDCGKAFTDADGDGIPALYTYTFDCEIVYGNEAAGLFGTVYLKDDNDNNASSGYQIKLTDLTILYINGLENLLIGLQANQDSKLNVVAAGKYNNNQTFKFVGLRYANSGTVAFEYSTSGTSEYTPTGSTNSTRFAQGTLKFNNSFGFQFDSPTVDYKSDLKFLTNGLQVNQTNCGSNAMVNGGNVQFTDNKNTLTWNVTGCGDGGWNYN